MTGKRRPRPNNPPPYVLELVGALETDPACLFFFQRSWAVVATNERIRSMAHALADPDNLDAATIWPVLRQWAASSTGFRREVQCIIGEAVISERDAFGSPYRTRSERDKIELRLLRSARQFADAAEAHPEVARLPAEYIWRKAEIDAALLQSYEIMLDSEEAFRRVGLQELDIANTFRHWPSYEHAVNQVLVNRATMSQLTRQLISFVESMPKDGHSPRPKARTAKAVRFQRSLALYAHKRHPSVPVRQLAVVVHGFALCIFRMDKDLADSVSFEATLELVKVAVEPKPSRRKSAT